MIYIICIMYNGIIMIKIRVDCIGIFLYRRASPGEKRACERKIKSKFTCLRVCINYMCRPTVFSYLTVYVGTYYTNGKIGNYEITVGYPIRVKL